MVSPNELAAQASCYGLTYGILEFLLSDWIMILVALGQLTLWSFKIMNDGFKGSKINSEKSDSELSKSYSIAGLIFTIPHGIYSTSVNAIPFNKSEFYQCYTIVQPRPGVDITITPDPPVAKTPEHFTVSGTLKHDITADKTLLNIDFYDTSKFLSAIPPYNKNFTESFKAGTKFSIDVDNVPTPDKLPLFYAIIVTVGKNLGEDEHTSQNCRHNDLVRGLDCGLLRFCCRSCVSRASDCRDFDRILIRVQENAELKDKNAEIPDLKRKFAEIESEKVELKTRIAELLRQAVEESKRRNVENVELKARIEELEKNKADSSAENVRRDVEFAELKTENQNKNATFEAKISQLGTYRTPWILDFKIWDRAKWKVPNDPDSEERNGASVMF
ncbi:hypothetical protein RhiirA1_460136 [Rhizophagus irregularis]|uniref:Uncharacterized protein n=2 Tax=Rhizophagus irregularis TaxID=588596 RepID=A0A2N0RS39_9GLOM|nr:hypothetical protein RhiirA1_460136 [Rhizophagus irregularis]